MNVVLEPGKYIIAVSGGVDSIVLLHLLAQMPDIELVVAHFDHGIRDDSAEDARFVEALAQKYGYTFISRREELGANASEATARERRYLFLNDVVQKHEARAIILGHHQDDLIETAALNTLRGTKRRGLVSLRSTTELQRPLLDFTKQQILDYAVINKLEWQEDSTNLEDNYLRNKLRRKLSRRMTTAKRDQVIKLLDIVLRQNIEIDLIVNEYLATQPNSGLHKEQLCALEPEVAYEIVAAWLRKNEVNFDATAIVRVINGTRSLQNGSQIDVQGGWYCVVKKDKIILTKR